MDDYMELDEMLGDSFAYTKEALWGKWVRWITFMILSIPFTLIPFVFDMDKIVVGTEFHWELVPWDQVALVLAAGILFSFVISGYLVRIYKGTKPAPDFTEWGRLFIDGIKLHIVWLLWFVPVAIIVLAPLAIAIIATVIIAIAGAGSNVAAGIFIGAVLVAIVIEFALIIIALLYGCMGAIRFARMGSIREGIRFGAIGKHIRTIGWGSYILALIVIIIIGAFFLGISYLASLMPYACWAIEAAITPFIAIFIARFITLLYEQGEKQQPAEPAVVPA
ncbi:MAG: hypothetical protein METHP_00535 [Methanoregula sp. SKADARSKE-2]|nr:MAG: hypothetical protein METHP_00535 [Methanoregula sp. SKADARSKE-2]